LTDTQLFEDTGNYCIRKISTDGIVTTISGQPGVNGFKDGRDSLWYYPSGLIVGQHRELFVTDLFNHAVRRISLDDLTVVTIAGGKQQHGGHFDGQGVGAQFYFPQGITQLSNKDLIVADGDNCVLRQITPDGQVTTIAGISFFLFVWICCLGLK
jgi:hypothetical protein